MRDFSKVRRIVIKVGTNLLTSKEGIDEARIGEIAREISLLAKAGKQVLLVSSGAIGMGAKELRLKDAVKQVSMRQACAAIGQPVLMDSYRREFAQNGLICSQLLLTRKDMNNRTTYVNLRNCIFTLFSLNVVPILNENDVVSTAEIGSAFGDNDRMSAMVASKVDADLLVILSDIEGFYTADPKKDPSAILIRDIPSLSEEAFSHAGGAGSRFATGGMKTKLLAARIATYAGCGTVIASGYGKDVLQRIVRGEEVGSFIHPSVRLSQKERWILNNSHQGSVTVDAGAKAALLSHKSLLPKGVKAVHGDFGSGDVIQILGEDGIPFAKAVPYYDSTDTLAMAGHTTEELDGILGKGHKAVLFRPEDMVLLDGYR